MTDTLLMVLNTAIMFGLFLMLKHRTDARPAGLLVAWLASSFASFLNCTLALMYGWWDYPSTELTRYGTMLVKGILYYPFPGMIYYMLLGNSFFKNGMTTAAFAGVLTGLEAFVLYFSTLLRYNTEKWNLFDTYLSYLIALSFVWLITRLHERFLRR